MGRHSRISKDQRSTPFPGRLPSGNPPGRKSRTLLGPGDVPIHDQEVRLAFFKEVGQQTDFQAVLEHDLIGANARAKRIDERRAKENPAETGKRPATRLATAILMYSFGGLKRESKRKGNYFLLEYPKRNYYPPASGRISIAPQPWPA